MSQFRQLAAIMFTDIVGYTALMGRDEQMAFKLLATNRQIHKQVIEQYNGKLIKELGDGVMASFHTVSDAVNAAIEIQKACAASKELSLRIGIHEGEIIFEVNDIYGDAVNIASRIQTLGEGFENITVLDISEKAINKAEERLRKSAAKVKWVVVDVTEFEPTQTYEPGEESYKEIPNYRNILVSHCICQVLN